MAGINLLANESAPKGRNLLAEPPAPKTGFAAGTEQVAGGALEAIPFVGEKLAKSAGIPEPQTFPERLTRRTARNVTTALPFAMTGVGALPALGSAVLATGAGQAAEEIGVPKEYQPIAEIAGGGSGQLIRDVSGRALGYSEKYLSDAAKKANEFFEVGSGAKTQQGMKYGHGETPQANIRNLQKSTQMATEKTGFPSTVVDGQWVKNTGDELGKKVTNLFSGKTFTTDPQFNSEIANLSNEATSFYGDKANVIKTILEKNIGGQRAGGSLVGQTFDAMNLKNAITEVNSYLRTAEGPEAALLSKLNKSLNNLAEANLTGAARKEYKTWRENYHAYATIRDMVEKNALTEGKQIPINKLSEEIARRTGGQPTQNPLYKNLGEFAGVFQEPKFTTVNAAKALYEGLTQNPLAEALQTMMQPKIRTKTGDILATGQTLAPSLLYTQQKKKPGEQ